MRTSDNKEVIGVTLDTDNAAVDAVDNAIMEDMDDIVAESENETQVLQDVEDTEDVLDAQEPLDKVVFFALDEARQKLEQGGEVEPFTVIVSGDNLFIESHPGDDIVECFNSARKTLFDMELLADAYVFCYDGYVQLDGDTRDALIAERAVKTDEVGEAFALLYTIDEEGDGSIEFEDSLYHLGEAPSLYGASEFDEGQFEDYDDDETEDSDDEESEGSDGFEGSDEILTDSTADEE